MFTFLVVEERKRAPLARVDRKGREGWRR